MTSSSKAPPAWLILLAFGVIYTSWGTTYYAIKLGVQQERLPPLLFGGTRLAAAGVILLVWQVLRRQSVRISGRDFLTLLGVSWLLFLGGNGLITTGQKYVDSSLAAVLVATTPLWIGLFALLLPHGERLSLRGWLGLLFGLAGVTLLLEPGLRQSGAVNLFAVALVLGSAASWALGSLLLRRARVEVAHLTAAGYEMLLGGVSLNLIGLALGEGQLVPERLAPGAIGVFLYLLLVGSLTGFVAFNWLLGHVSAAKVGTYAYVNPLVAVLIGWFFGEAVSGRLWAGIGVILLGVFLVRGGERPLAPRREETTEESEAALPLAQET